MSKPLLDRITNAVPKIFWTHLQERQVAIYKQSLETSFAETLWTRTEAFSILPVIRRALWEHAMRQAAVPALLKPFDTPHQGDNCSCVTVKADRLIITGHFVDGPNQAPREAESRKQNAAVNKFLTHYVDENLLLEPLPKLGNKPIYLHILHGAQFPSLKSDKLDLDPETCFLHVGVPAQDCVKYIFNWSFDELLAEYPAEQDAEQRPGSDDKAHPQRKPQLPEDEKRKNKDGRR